MKDKKSCKSYKSHKRVTKLTLHSCAWRCLSKLQEIQSWETLFGRPYKVHKYQYTQTHIVFVLIFYKNNLKQNKRKKQTNKTSKLDWLKPQHEPCKRSEKRINHLESCSLLIGDLDGDPFFCMNLCSDG